jgi:hypothetical protein
MLASMAKTTKCDQVFFRIVTKRTAGADVVNLEILQRPASLAPPSVPLQHSLVKCSAQFRIQAQLKGLDLQI